MLDNPDPLMRAKINNLLIKELNKIYTNITYPFKRFPGFRAMNLDFEKLPDKWGLFSPQRKMIILNEDLYFKGSWQVVTGVLTHEIAHQLHYQLYPYSYQKEGPHGKTFKKITKSLHLCNFYSNASLDISKEGELPPNPISKNIEENNEHPILVKVKKLLALSTSDEAHEAAAALAAAERLLLRYNLEMPDGNELGNLGNTQGFMRWRLHVGKRFENKHSIISSILKEAFFVETVICSEFNPLTQSYEKCLEILGKSVNLSMAEHVFYFLLERCETLWQAFRPKAYAMGEKGISAKQSFIINMLTSFREKLEKERNTISQDQDFEKKRSELILSSVDALQAFLKESYPHLRQVSHSHRAFSPNSAMAGRQEGARLTIHSPVPQGKSGVQGRLE
jgi:predicted SprT family Zn-dependent metalloprotease